MSSVFGRSSLDCPGLKVIAEAGDTLPRLREIADLILNDPHSGLCSSRWENLDDRFCEKRLTKVIKKTLANGGILLTANCEHTPIAALLLRPLWNLLGGYEVIAFAHNWGAVFELPEDASSHTAEKLGDEFRLLAKRTYQAFQSQLKNIERAHLESSLRDENEAPSLFAIFTPGGNETPSWSETSYSWIGGSLTASSILGGDTHELYSIPTSEGAVEEKARLADRVLKTPIVTLSQNACSALKKELSKFGEELPFTIHADSGADLKTANPSAQELCLRKVSDIPRGGIYLLEQDSVTDGISVVANIPHKSKPYSVVLVDTASSAQCRRIDQLLEEGFQAAGTISISPILTYLVFAGCPLQATETISPGVEHVIQDASKGETQTAFI